MRKKFKKLLGKECNYTATVGAVGSLDSNIVLEDVKYNGKIMTDHIWISLTTSLKSKKKGDVVSFRGIAVSYIDSKNIRKYGLEKCHSFKLAHEAWVKMEHDYKHRNRRKK